jgi:hypothetical protein
LSGPATHLYQILGFYYSVHIPVAINISGSLDVVHDGQTARKARHFPFYGGPAGNLWAAYLNAGSHRAKTIWRILLDAGYTVGTMNIPFTYPPENLNGFQISGMDTPSGKSPFIYPPQLRSELVGLLGRFSLDLRYLGFMSTDARRYNRASFFLAVQ